MEDTGLVVIFVFVVTFMEKGSMFLCLPDTGTFDLGDSLFRGWLGENMFA